MSIAKDTAATQSGKWNHVRVGLTENILDVLFGRHNNFGAHFHKGGLLEMNSIEELSIPPARDDMIPQPP